MYDRASFPRNGKWARHLLRLSNVSNIDVDDQLRELAQETSYDASALGSTIQWSRRELNALQYTMDWNGRCVLLDMNRNTYANHVAVSAALQLGSKRLLIVERQDDSLLHWGMFLRKAFPLCSITSRDPRPGGRLRVFGAEDSPVQIALCKFNELENLDLIGEIKPDHIIVGVDLKGVDYTISDMFKGLCAEFNRVTVVAQTTEFWNSAHDFHTNTAMVVLGDIIGPEYLGLNAFQGRIPALAPTSQEVMKYYRPQGVRVDPNLFFESAGVCFNMVADRISKHFKNVFSTGMLDADIGQHSQRRVGIIERYRTIENDRCALIGMTVEETITAALAGSQPAREMLEALKTQEWARLKAHMFYNLLKTTAKADEKTIVVARHPEIRKYIGTQLTAQVVEENVERERKLMNFCYPHPNHKQFVDHTNPRISMAIIVDDIAKLDERVLEVADRVIFTEFPYSVDEISDYVELTKIFRFRTLFGTMRGTFEDKLSEELLQSFY